MFGFLKKHISKKILFLLIILLVFGIIFLIFRANSLNINPVSEKALMEQLEETKQKSSLVEFTSDGCSADISKNWTLVVEKLSDLSGDFADKYTSAEYIPFESACIEHDRAYHAGIGGYAARLVADSKLRSDILEYAISNTDEIQLRTSLNTPEEAIFLYEQIANLVYQGVRLGGAPCTGETYAWGYGYNNGSCNKQ